MTLPKGEKHHFIIQCDSHPLSLSNMPYVPVTGRLAGLSSVTGLFTHCSQSDTISCRKKNHHYSTVTGCQAEGTNVHRALAESLPIWGKGAKARGYELRRPYMVHLTTDSHYWHSRCNSVCNKNKFSFNSNCIYAHKVLSIETISYRVFFFFFF